MGRVLPAFELNSIQIADADGINVIPKFNQHFRLDSNIRYPNQRNLDVDCKGMPL